MMRNAAIASAVSEARAEVLDFLTALVDTGSFVHRPEGVSRVADMVDRRMPRGFAHEAVAAAPYAPYHRYEHVRGGWLPVVLAGHLDTLCPPDSPFQRLEDRGETLVGPGVCDMKGGIVVIVEALRVLDRCGLVDDMSVVCVFNSDEEVGSPTSRGLFTGMAGKAACGLVFEAGGPGGTAVTTRCGVDRYRLDITGRASHFGCLKGRKVSAIEELARKTLAIESLNSADGSVTANVGRVEGGLAANKVADRAVMDFEIRYWDDSAGEAARRRVAEVAAAAEITGIGLALERLSYRPPMTPTPASRSLFARACGVAQALGLALAEERRGGVSDANWLMYAGVPTLDGLGPVGDLDFTEDEYIVKESLFERIELTAHLLLSLHERPL